jgi:pilus assembly protein CpaE
VAVVMLVARETDATLRRAMASGVRAVLAADAGAKALAEVLHSVSEIRRIRQEAEFPLVTDPQRMPRSIAVTGARGGVGKTTVAVNLAVTFAKRHPGQVVLVDFPGQFGDAALALDITPHDTIADLAAFDELDPELIETHLATHQPSSLRLLASPDMLREGDYNMERLDVHFMASLIGLLRRAFRYVFFDVPPLHWPTSQYVFTRCQQILVVANHFDLATIRNTKALLELTAASGMADENRVKLIANRATWKGEFKLDDLQTTTGRKVYFELPDDFENATGALNTGVPIVLDQPNCALARAFNTLADHLLAEL